MGRLHRSCAALVLTGAGACAAGTGGTGGATASSTSDASSASTNASSSTGMLAAGSSSVSTGVGGGCVGVDIVANPIPLDLFMMIDQSGSMLMDAGNMKNRWQTIQAAMTAFVQEPSSKGIGIGLQYFGLPQPDVAGCYVIPCTSDADCTPSGCGTCNVQGVCTSSYNPDIDSCDPQDYAWPEVLIANLPMNGGPIVTSIAAHLPGTNTPTAPALGGAIQYAQKWATDHPSHVVVVVLATDGDPSECDTDIGHIEDIAAAGFAGTPSMRTFVIGVGPSLSNLDGIAAAGGTTTAFHVDFDPNATDAFLGAMNKIRGVAVGCAYVIPEPPVGMGLDYGEVNVQYKPGDMSPPETFPHVASGAACPPSGDAWFYDDPAAPTTITLCPNTCDKVSSDIFAEVDVVLGCETIVP